LQEVLRTLRCKVTTAHAAADWTPTASNGFHLPLSTRDTTQWDLFMTSTTLQQLRTSRYI